MNKKTTRRFISGAICSSCQLMDKIVMYKEHGKVIKECVSCGFRESLDAVTASTSGDDQVPLSTIATDQPVV